MINVGDLVYLITDRYGISADNPLKEEILNIYEESIIGEVTNISYKNYISVDWDNGKSNTYVEQDLEVVESFLGPQQEVIDEKKIKSLFAL